MIINVNCEKYKKIESDYREIFKNASPYEIETALFNLDMIDTWTETEYMQDSVLRKILKEKEFEIKFNEYKNFLETKNLKIEKFNGVNRMDYNARKKYMDLYLILSSDENLFKKYNQEFTEISKKYLGSR